jgi:hypothetical protein
MQKISKWTIINFNTRKFNSLGPKLDQFPPIMGQINNPIFILSTALASSAVPKFYPCHYLLARRAGNSKYLKLGNLFRG